MGCRTSKPKEEVIVAIATKSGVAINKRDRNLTQILDISEFSLRECSLIHAQVETADGHKVEDQSIFNIIKELQ